MRKTTRDQKEREAQFDIAAHQKEIDRLLRENAKLKAQQFTMERELLLRPPYDEQAPSAADKYMQQLAHIRSLLKAPTDGPAA